jgi:tetrapyrrole methylase family protein / MazG family protein
VTGDSDPAPHLPDGPVPTDEQGRRLLELVKVMARLRGPGGCPWDREQTHETLGHHLLEEAHELLEAIDAGDSEAIRDELGDLLLQVVFHAQMASDDGRWDVDDVARGLVEKLVHRHPHVFGDLEVSGAEEVLTNWEQLKVEEGSGARAHVDDEIPVTLPALARAAKVQRRAAGWGVVWPSSEDAVVSLRGEVERLSGATEDAEREIGGILFAAVAAARSLGVDAETALRRTTRGFADRYEQLRARAEERGVDLDSLPMDELRDVFHDTGNR